MKDRIGAILRPEQERYLERLQPPRDEVLRAIEADAAVDGVPISDPEVGRLLTILAAATRARRILELGTAIGYGAVLLARGAPEARVTTIDRDPAMHERARGHLARAGVADRVELLHGEVREILPTLSGPFDLVYVDFAKTEYRRALDLVLPRVVVGGTLVFDNLLWKGLIGEPPEEDDADTAAVRAFNPYLMIHPQLAAQILPLGDGVGLAVKTRPTIQEMGGPF